MMNNLLLVGVGGAAGSMLRYLCQRAFNVSYFPYGTLLVNLSGCFLVGLLMALFTKNSVPESLKLLLIVGFCGGFTTFSSFAAEGLLFIQKDQWILMAAYVALSVFLGLLASFFGYKLFL